MESNNLVEPGKSKLVNVYGDSSELDVKTLENYGVSFSGKAVAPVDGIAQNTSSKNKKKISENLTSKVFFRFVKTKDTEYSLTVDQLGFKDSESSKDLKVNAEFATGVHTWELIFPICISNVEFGAISNSSLKKYSRKFKTTTPRFVTVTLDADKQRILYRLNKDPFTDKIVKIDTEGPYSPFVSTSKAEVEVILNPYPRVLNHQKLLGKQFNEREYLKNKLVNTFAVSHLPKGFGVNNDSAFVTKYFDRNEKEIESVYLPKDNSPFQALSGWAVIKVDKEESYKQWVAKTITAEGRKVVIHNTQELVDYASDKSIQSRLRGETLQLAKYIYDTYNQDDESVTEHSVFKGLNDFYLKVNTLFNTPYQRSTESPGLVLHELSDGKLLVVSEGKAKVVEKDLKNAPLNFEHGPKSVHDVVLLTLSKEEVKTLFAYVDWNLLSKKHLEMNRGYVQFFKAAKESATLAGATGENLEFSVPLNIAKLVIDDLLHTLSKVRLSRSREFVNLSVIGMEDEHQLKHTREPQENPALKTFEVYNAIEKDVSVQDINTVLNIVYRLDEQLWCRSLFGHIREDISKLFAGVSRPNSALDRLSTFVGQDEPLHKLAEYGYVYRADDALQNVFNDRETRQISTKCHDSINDALVLKNNINVDLGTSLTYLPPSKLGKNNKVLTSKVSDYVFSFTQKGVCKVYTTGMNLIEVATIDFKEDAADYIAYSNENKKYIASLVNFEINNAKAKANFSASIPLNIKKEKLQVPKGGDVVNKYKPKKGAKATFKKVVNNAQYDEEEDVMDLGNLFGEGDDEYENEPDKEETKDVAPEEEVKEKDTDQKKEPPANIKVLGYSALVQKKFKNQEYQASVSCAYESEGKIILATRALHIDIQPTHLKFCDFAKYGSSKNTNKKKNQEQVASEIINSHRKNIVHYIPFFHNRDSTEHYSSLVVAEASELDLSETLTKVIAMTETNHSLENTNQLYILGVNKDNKAVLLQIELSSKESEFKSAIVSTTEVADLNVSSTYQVVAKDNKVAIAGDGAVRVFNTKDFTERHDTKVDGQLTNQHVLEVIDQTEVKHIEEPKPEVATENKEEKKQEKTETTQAPKEEEKPKVEEPVEKKDVTVDLLKEGDCDLKELDQIFISKPMRVVDDLKYEDGQAVIEDLFTEKTQDFDKLKLKLLFNSKSTLTQNKDALNGDCVEYKKKESKNIYEKLAQVELRVHSNTGSQINPTRPPSAVIDANNNESYISNYPRPTIIFTHHQEIDFVPVQFTVSSKFHREKSNADSYPMGAGLVFCANSVKEFDNVKRYYQIQTKEQYDRWLENRKGLKLPLRENEPAAFFELDADREITVSFEEPRSCKYVLLMPTDFRKRPIKFTKKFYSHNCEIESFKVTGREVKIVEENSQEYESEVKADQFNVKCNIAIEVKQNGNWQHFHTLNQVNIKEIESLTDSYCVSLLNRTKSCVTGSFTTEINMTSLKEDVEGVRVRVVNDNNHGFWSFKNGHFVVFKYPSTLNFKSKGLKRINESSILHLYRNNDVLKYFVKQLITVVHYKDELEHTRMSILQHLNRLQSKENLDMIRENFNFVDILEDSDLYTYSDNFKATVFKTINKIGLANPDSNDRSFFDFANKLIDRIQDKGISNFDITTMKLIYMINKEARAETFQKNYELLTHFIFEKALPELEKSKEYYPININTSAHNHISAGVLISRAKNEYELTTDFGTKHSIDYIRLLFDEDTFKLVLSMKISVYEVDSANRERLLFKETYGDEVYQLCTRKQDATELSSDNNRNFITINLRDIETQSRYYRIKIVHVHTYQSKGSDTVVDPVHAVVPLYYGQDTGVAASVNNTFKALKTDINQASNKLDDMLRINGMDFLCYEKGPMYLAPKKFTKKDLKTLKDPEASTRLLAAKRKEQYQHIKNREYEKAHELVKEIKQIKTKARSKLAKYNNVTLSEALILSSEIMNYLSQDEFNKEGSKVGISTLPEKEQYQLLKNIVEWYLLPKEEVSKVISLKPAHKISKIILRNISNANSIFFDLIERLLKKRTQTHKKIFDTLEEFIKEMSVTDILTELLRRLNVSTEVTDQSIDSPEKLNELIHQRDVKEKDDMWVIVGTLQIIKKRLQKINKDDKKTCLQNLVLLATLRFKANDYEHSMYYKLLLELIKECFKDVNSDSLLDDATLPIRMWFNVLTLSTDAELYNLMLKFLEKVLVNSATNKKKANDIVHNILVWYSDLNNSKNVDKVFKDTIFEGIYANNAELFSTHYCQSIDLFLATFRSDAEDPSSNKLVSDIFNNIMSALNKPSKSSSFAKIWNELFKCLAIIGNNEESVDKFVSTFLSLPGEIQDNLYTHFEIDNVNLDSTKKLSQKKFTVSVIYKILRCFFKHGLKEDTNPKDQLRVYTICDDLICKLATTEPCDVNLSKAKTPVQLTKEEYIETLHLFNEYLNCYLNKGYYNHMAGASYVVLARLKMGVHLSYLVYNSEIDGKKYYELFVDEFEEVSIQDKAAIVEKQIIWLLLNNPTAKGKSDPCSMQHNRITKTIIERLPTNKQLIFELLPNVMKQVIKFDNMILKNCHKLGIERSSALQSNSNAVISLLFNVCIQDKELFNDFLVKMKGFDFFLQRLFSKTDTSDSLKEESKDDEEETIHTDTKPEQEDTELIENLFEEMAKVTKPQVPPTTPSTVNLFGGNPPQDQNKDTKSKEKKGIDKVNFSDAGKTMKLIESTIGAENQTQDWVMYKNGQRNRIIYKHIDKTYKSDFIMKFECSEVIEVSDIQMGLIYYWGNYDQDMHYEPMQVFCEGGMTKHQIDWSVPLRLADDGGYRQSAVNVYGANFAHFNSMNYDVDKYHSNASSVILTKLREKSQVYRAKYITFRLRRPEICCLESSMFSTVLTKTMSYGFTFFSVQGIYPDNYLPLKNALLDVQKENTLEILSECCSGNLAETFGIIANDKVVIDGFKHSINKLSQLLEQKEYLIKPIFIALCSQNSEMADWIIDRFLDIKANQKQISLIGEIIKRDTDKSDERIKKILKYILDQVESDDIKTMESLSDILEIFSFFQGMTDKVSIDYNVKYIDMILDKTIDCNDETQELVLSFILFLFELSKPKKDEVMTSEEIVEYLIKVDNDESDEKQGLKMRLASTLCAASSDLSQIIMTKEKLLEGFLNIETNDMGVWKFKTRFWYNCAQEKNMNKYLAEKEVPQKIFEKFRKQFGPTVEDNVSDQELNSIIVSFVSSVTTGNEKIEKDIAKMLKDDLEISCNNDRLDYLNAIVVPLLHSEDTIPITISVGDKEQEQLLYHPIYYKPKDAASENKFLFKSNVLSKSQENSMMRMFKEHVREYHDSYDKLIQKKWTLIAEDDVPKKGDFQKISDKISEKSNTLHLVKCTINGESAVFGGFCAATFPSLVGLQSDYNYELPHDDANFVFYYKGDMENHFIMTNNKPFGYIYTDYELGGVISISGDFVLCSWSINYSHTAGNIYNMKCVEQPGFASFYNNIQVERYECWHVDLGNPALSNLNNENKSAYYSIPFYKSLSPFNLLTDNVVFHVAKHMKAKVLSCELFGRKQNLHIKNSQAEVDLEKQIEEIVSENQEGYNKNIFELAYERPAKEDEQTKEETKEVEKVLEEYETKYTILEKFDGAEELVKACQKAIQSWTNKELREAWDQWLKEVQSFISFPGFFTRLTSDRKNSTLFFDILSGIPEKQTKEALKKREKEIEKKKQYQYNYKAPEFENEWIDKQLEMVKLTYNVVQRIFEEDKNSEELREKCLQNGMINTFIERIGLLTGEVARTKVHEKEYETDSEEETIKTEAKKKKRDKNRKGVGYTTDVGQEWNVNSYLKKKESKNSQISDIIGILKGIIMSKELSIKYNLRDLILESALLPVLENAFRSGSILEMAKEAELYNSYLDFITIICENDELTCLLMEIGKDYEPNQLEPVYKLLDKLTGLAEIFLKALSSESKEDTTAAEESKKSKELAEKIRSTNQVVQKTVSAAMHKDEESISDILMLPLAQKYRKLLSPLRFGYMDMKSSPSSSSYTHYYSYNISQDTSIEKTKVVRLAQEIADLSNSLPNDHTNAIFVRVDESRVDVMKAIICGAAETPYAHGCFEFDLYFDPRYPQTPPKCQLVTTGSGAVRFNPNLYADGKVCLSLLGTWRGSATENWDAKFSTILQVLMSIQAIIMSEEVYYNEPGYEHEAGTTEGEAKNEAYSNIVRYCNIQYAMIDQMLNPSKGFEEAIRKHFFLKREEIMAEVNEWLVFAAENKATYASLVECHNHSWCQKFKEEGKYKSMLKEIIEKLDSTFKGLKEPTLEHELKAVEPAKEESKAEPEVQKAATEVKKEKGIKATDEDNKLLEEVDVEDDEEVKVAQEINIDDEGVKDRWSRYIGAMGIDAVAKQANAKIFIYGLGGLGAEIAKNLVLAGCKELTLCDAQLAAFRDLSSNFFLTEKDIGTNRAAACVKKVQQLNYYVKVSLSKESLQDEKSIEAANLKDYDVVIITEATLDVQKLVNDYCRKNNTKFISSDVNGVFCRIFNDFGDEFEVIDKDGEEIKELMIKEITNDKEGLVTLQEGFRHPFEDGDEVLIEKVVGMTTEDGKSINGTIHKVITVTPSSFKIGDTTQYSNYEHSGLGKQLKTKLKMNFKSLSDISITDIPHDSNLMIADFEKMDHNNWSHYCYNVVDEIKKTGKYLTIKDWKNQSFQEFGQLFEEKLKALLTEEVVKELVKEKKFEKFIAVYCLVNHGTFNPLCAFIGGIVSQEAVKAITNKFVPINQFFYYNAIEVVPDFKIDTKETFEADMNELGFMTDKEDRYSGLRACIGNKLLNKIHDANLFVVGAGAIGCELLKNYAMIGAGSSSEGSILVTDPDVIEVSNLNRQFLFREKHLRKPKSVTAAAAAIHMNPDMKGRIIAKLDKIHKGTEDTYNQQFYKSISMVTNALDNVAARRYLDGQCVKARIPMLDSGTLGPKGHIQVVLPNKTESYSSTNDAEDTTEIPHCTLKMFPEETLHCVEWARDLFSQLFNQSAKSYNKIVEDEEIFDPNDSEQKKIVKEALSLLEDRPTDFKACIRWARFRFNQYFVNDIKQLLHAYPLDHKTKDGKPFWSLPKRAPEPLDFDSEDELHAKFIAAAACLRATVFNIEIPFKAPREREAIMKMAQQANEYNDELPEFRPDKSKAEEMKAEVDEEQNKKEAGEKEEEKVEEEEETIETGEDFDEIKEFVFMPLRKAYREHKDNAEELKIILATPQEFEKDNDANFHIDFIYALSNCRARNYTLDPMDWITTKLKAGRIIPALATTTSSIAGLQTLEMIKLLNDTKLEDLRNINLNLAVPSLMASEPGPPQKVKLREGLEISIWDTWTVHFPKDAALKDLIKKLQKKFKLEPKDIFKEGLPIYLHALDSVAPTGKKDKTLEDLFKIPKDQTEIEITVTFSDPEDKEEKILDGTPPIIIKFD